MQRYRRHAITLKAVIVLSGFPPLSMMLLTAMALTAYIIVAGRNTIAMPPLLLPAASMGVVPGTPALLTALALTAAPAVMVAALPTRRHPTTTHPTLAA
jgi:hypothetical protein